MHNIPLLSQTTISNKRVVVRSDFDVSLRGRKIADESRILHALPTIELLLKHHNRVVIISKLNRPKERDKDHSMTIVAEDLKKYLKGYHIKVVDDFLTEDPATFTNQKEDEVLLLENIRFYPEEKANDPEFAKKLAALGEVFVLDAFAMAHRKEASVTGIPHFLPSFAGLQLEKEMSAITKVLDHAQKPFVAIMGGAKIPDKLAFLAKLIELADYLLVGGGIANTFLYAQGYEIGKSLVETTEREHVHHLFALAKKHHTQIILPSDVVGLEGNAEVTLPINQLPKDFSIFDIGPETQAHFGNIIANAKTIVWNGPLGYMEDPRFARGTDFLYYSITENHNAFSLVGGGDTLAAISKKEYLDHISHISTGGGAMLEYIENGTLPGIEALRTT